MTTDEMNCTCETHVRFADIPARSGRVLVEQDSFCVTHGSKRPLVMIEQDEDVVMIDVAEARQVRDALSAFIDANPSTEAL